MLSFMIYESRNLNSAFNSLPIYIQSNQLMSLKVVSAQLREKKQKDVDRGLSPEVQKRIQMRTSPGI